MKKTHILAIIVIAISIGAIMSTISDSSTYSTFAVAKENKGTELHVVGQLDKSKEMDYSPELNANLFSFYVNDKDGNNCKVIFNGSKPQDFERSEQVVLTGKYMNDHFEASKILMKCPSKYNDGSNSEFKEIEAVNSI
jgi:cytochrome c-type biogenesis protein CcmE